MKFFIYFLLLHVVHEVLYKIQSPQYNKVASVMQCFCIFGILLCSEQLKLIKNED